MDWFDQLSLPAIIITPLIGALFLLFIPDYDALLRKRVALFVIATATVFHVRTAILLFQGSPLTLNLESLRPSFIAGDFQLRMDLFAFAALSHVLIIIFLLLFCELSRNSQARFQLNSKALFVLGLASAGFLFDNFAFRLLVQSAVTQSLFILNLRDGGAHRSSSALAASIFFIFFDLSAFFAWSWQTDLALWLDPRVLSFVTLLPFIMRLLVPFFSAWSRKFFANASVEIMVLYLGTAFIAGAEGISRSSFESSLLSQCAIVAAFFGALLSLSDKGPSQFLMRYASVGGALILALLTTYRDPSFGVRALLYACSLALTVSLALLFQRAVREDKPEKIEHSFFTLWLAAFALLLGIPFLGVGGFLWQILPNTSPLWLIIFSILTLSLSLRVRLEPALTSPLIRILVSPFSKGAVFNAWCCLALVLTTSMFFQFIFPSAVQSQ